jgi:hypothetical protein
MEQIEKLKKMIYSAEISQLVTQSQSQTTVAKLEDKKMEEETLAKKKKKAVKKTIEGEKSSLGSFVPADKHKFYVPQPRSTVSKRWPTICKPLSQHFILNNVALEEFQDFFETEEQK